MSVATSRPPRRFLRRLLVVMLTVGLVPTLAFIVLGRMAVGRLLSVSLAPLESTLDKVDAELERSGSAPAAREELRQARLNLVQAELARRSLQRLLPRALIGLLALSLGVVGAAAVAFGRSLSSPVERLAAGMESYARGDLGRALAESADPAPDELEFLVRQFNRMGEDLRVERERLRRTEAQAAWQELARTLAHELKNPLTAMKMAVGRLARTAGTSGGPADEAGRRRESLELLDEEIGVLMRMAQSFAELARLPAPCPRRVDLAALLTESARLYASASPVPIECRPAPDVAVDGDPDHLRRAFGNLLKNAVEASSAGGRPIEVAIAREGAAARVTVRDGGVGIGEAREGAALLSPLPTTKPDGSGLGLPIAQKIVHDHGGSLRLEPGDGGGTVARVDLPVARDLSR
jgi:nitrogen fixation/metabolism regulation signal transduction histidine kinase